MTTHLYLPRTGDKEIILNNIKDFRKMDDAELQHQSEIKKKLGIVGAHHQALNLIAFNILYCLVGHQTINKYLILKLI